MVVFKIESFTVFYHWCQGIPNIISNTLLIVTETLHFSLVKTGYDAHNRQFEPWSEHLTLFLTLSCWMAELCMLNGRLILSVFFFNVANQVGAKRAVTGLPLLPLKPLKAFNLTCHLYFHPKSLYFWKIAFFLKWETFNLICITGARAEFSQGRYLREITELLWLL